MFRKVKNIIEFRALSLAAFSSQELLIGETRMKRVRGSQQVGESPSSSQQAKKTSLTAKISKEFRCAFLSRAIKITSKIPPQFRPIAPKNNITVPRSLREKICHQGEGPGDSIKCPRVLRSGPQADITRQSRGGLRKYQVCEIRKTFDL